MKRIAHFAAVLAIVLLVVQPALAASFCVVGQNAVCTTGCPMAMAGMGPDCPMASGMVASGCSMDCCSHGAMLASESQATADRHRSDMRFMAVVEPAAIAGFEPIADRRIISEILGVSPPRYILNQVFRI
jgi:hypothetical protein